MCADDWKSEAGVAERILVVDDDKIARDELKRLLQDEFCVETAVNGGQGLGSIHLFGPYAIVIAGLRMPEMDGLEFLEQVRQIAPSTVRMLAAAHKDRERAIEGVRSGCVFRCVAKPCDKSDLMQTIRLGLSQYRANSEAGAFMRKAKEFKIGYVEVAEESGDLW
jgi:DNA-binding NtrC family response regulator